MFNELGFETVISDESSRDIYYLGQHTIPSDTVCYPAKLTHGHIESLLNKNVDFIFYPFQKNDDAIIIELKVNHSADEAIQQIKDRQYALRFEGKFGEKAEYTGRILAVGIAYHKDDIKKLHECKVEVLREKIV